MPFLRVLEEVTRVWDVLWAGLCPAGAVLVQNSGPCMSPGRQMSSPEAWGAGHLRGSVTRTGFLISGPLGRAGTDRGALAEPSPLQGTLGPETRSGGSETSASVSVTRRASSPPAAEPHPQAPMSVDLGAAGDSALRTHPTLVCTPLLWDPEELLPGSVQRNLLRNRCLAGAMAV